MNALTQTIHLLGQPIRLLLLALIWLYQVLLSPLKKILLGDAACCRYYPSCSKYAQESLVSHGIIKGLILSCIRILKCNPFFEGGLDPVPSTFNFNNPFNSLKK